MAMGDNTSNNCNLGALGPLLRLSNLVYRGLLQTAHLLANTGVI